MGPLLGAGRVVARARCRVPNSSESCRRSGSRQRAWTRSSWTTTPTGPRRTRSCRRPVMPGPDRARRSSTRMPPGDMAALLADPAQRARHVEALAEFAEEGDYAGLDIDYEQFAFADDRSTWTTTRPSWVAFITELAERLHADGRTLTVSIPPVYDAGRTADSGYWVYDYASHRPGGRPHPRDGLRLLDRRRRAHRAARRGCSRPSTARSRPAATRPSWCSASRCTATTGWWPPSGTCPPARRRVAPASPRARPAIWPPARRRARVRRDDRGVDLHLPAGAVGRHDRVHADPPGALRRRRGGAGPDRHWPTPPASAAARSGRSATRMRPSGRRSQSRGRPRRSRPPADGRPVGAPTVRRHASRPVRGLWSP